MPCGSGLLLVDSDFGVAAAWAPFMDDVDAIIFLAPISCFDQVLAEDPTVNRLVCSPRLVPPNLVPITSHVCRKTLSFCGNQWSRIPS